MASDHPAEGRPSQSVLTIDLGAIAGNYRALRRSIAPQSICAAVVKADGYGLGAERIAPALHGAGCSHFYVAHLDEGVRVRRALGTRDADVSVLNGLLPGEAAEFRRHRLIPVLNDLGQIETWANEARIRAVNLPAAVHFDTGMSRLGLSATESERLAADPDRLAGLAIRFWISHLACADEPDHPFNHQQLDALTAILRKLPRAPVSFANSSGIFLGPAYHFDQVRPGCALYGINPVPGRANPMRQAVRLDARILQIRDIDHPQTVGYGASHRATARMRVATVAVGYADGWLRTLSNRGHAFVAGTSVPIIGRVSMDLITLDVTAVPNVRTGETVELMGENVPVDDVAATAGTIGYEVLTRLGLRFHRRYVNDLSHAPA